MKRQQSLEMRIKILETRLDVVSNVAGVLRRENYMLASFINRMPIVNSLWRAFKNDYARKYM